MGIDSSKALIEFNKRLSEWEIDRDGLASLAPPKDPFHNENSVKNQKIIAPLSPIFKLSSRHGALWSIVDIKNLYKNQYVYYVIEQQITQSNSLEKWRQFLKYPSKCKSHFEKNLLDLSKIVLRKSKEPIEPVLIYRDNCTADEIGKEFPLTPLNINDFSSKVKDELKDVLKDENFQSVQSVEKLIDNTFSKATECNSALCCRALDLTATGNKWEVDFNDPETKKKFYNYLFWLVAQNDDWKYYLYIPSVIKKEGQYESLGGMAIAFKEKPKPELYSVLLEAVNHFVGKLTQLYLELLRYMSALEYAGTAILVESYAHNIGAHALPGLKRHISRRTSHSQFAEFLDYLQGKSAFWNAASRLGKVFGGEIVSLWDLIDGFARNNLLCGSLGASEGFKGVEFHIHFQNEKYFLGISDRSSLKVYRFWEEGGKTEDDYRKNFTRRVGKIFSQRFDQNYFEKMHELRKKLSSCEVFLPEGIVGQQAVYTIWENILRNVKHCKKGGKYIPLHIEIEDKDEFYEITTWLGLEPAQNDNHLTESINRMNNWEGILVHDLPNLGGTSQNILCAGMVLGLDFFETEKKQKSRREKVMHFLKKIDSGKKQIAWKFKLWKGKSWIDWSKIKNKIKNKNVPPGRYKIVRIKQNEQKAFLERSSCIRHVEVESDNSEFGKLYREWVQKFILEKEKHPNGLILKHQLFDEFEQLFKFSSEEWKDKCNFSGPFYCFHHRCTEGCKCDNSKTIKVPYKRDGFIRIRFSNMKNDDGCLAEFIEFVGATIDIYDNRLYESYNRKLDQSQQGLLNRLNVQIEKENNLSVTQKRHFLVIHLGFLEKLTVKQGVEAIEEFWNQSYKDCYDFIIVTTGRARVSIPSLNKEIRMKMRYIPIENLEKCFEFGVTLDTKSPALGVKYALVKTIFGS